jgi:hypothetical protein
VVGLASAGQGPPTQTKPKSSIMIGPGMLCDKGRHHFSAMQALPIPTSLLPRFGEPRSRPTQPAERRLGKRKTIHVNDH